MTAMPGLTPEVMLRAVLWLMIKAAMQNNHERLKVEALARLRLVVAQWQSVPGC
jgi:hypothetical protein